MHNKINYLEIPTTNITASKLFFINVFGWVFTDFGEEYASFANKESGIDGGFYLADKSVATNNGSVLIVFYSKDLLAIQAKIQQNNGEITKQIFAFPGGKRFHFTDSSGNEFAIWSEQ